jgi:hypothetical protein
MITYRFTAAKLLNRMLLYNPFKTGFFFYREKGIFEVGSGGSKPPEP